MNAADRAACSTLAGLLSASRALGALGLVCTLLSGAVLLLQPMVGTLAVCAPVVFVAGIVERYLAFRLGLDRRLFATLAETADFDLAALDGALQTLGLRKQAREQRPLADRLRATRTLFNRHVLVVAVQVVGVLVAWWARVA